MTLQPLLHDSEVGHGTTSLSGVADIPGRTTQSVIVVSGALSTGGTSSAGPTTIWRGTLHPRRGYDGEPIEWGPERISGRQQAGGNAEGHLRITSNLRSDLGAARSASGGLPSQRPFLGQWEAAERQ